MVRVAVTRIVTNTYRYKRPPRKRKAAATEIPVIVRKRDAEPASGSGYQMAPSKIITTTSRKRSKLLRAERQTPTATGEVSPEVKAFFARMVRPGGALPPKR